MTYPTVCFTEGRTVRVSYPGVFCQSLNRSRDLFLQRSFGLAEVRSIEIEEERGFAVIHLLGGVTSWRDTVAALAAKLVEPSDGETSGGLQTYFEVQREGSWLRYGRAPRPLSGLIGWTYLGLGYGFLGLSIIGVASPFVPTTPFVLLSSYFFVRSSPAINRRLLQSRLFGPILRDWYLHRALRRSVRRKVLIIMVLVFALTIALAGPSSPALPMMLLVSLFSFGFVMQLPAIDDPQPEPLAAMPARLAPPRGAPLQFAPSIAENGGWPLLD